MDFPLENAPEHIVKNIQNWKTILNKICDDIDKLREGEYCRHLIWLLFDLEEEIKRNRDKFNNNSYGKRFFLSQLQEYLEKSPHKTDKNPKCSKTEWTRKVSLELFLICEVLCDRVQEGKLNLKDLNILINRILGKINSSDSLELTIELLLEQLTAHQPNQKEVEFLTTTIILLFQEKGTFASTLKNIVNDQLQTFEKIPEFDGVLYPTVYGYPKNAETTLDDYKQELKNYYESLTIRDRIFTLYQLYIKESKEYKVIFNLTGLRLPPNQDLKIGNVHFYQPKIHGNYISEENSNKFYLDFETTEYCVAVSVKGIDSTSMKLQAKQSAERAISAFASFYKREQEIILSDDFVIVDETRKVISFNSINSINKELDAGDTLESERYRIRVGEWLSSNTKLHPTVEIWFTALERYRKSVESQSSSDELLNSWFAVEHFINTIDKISIRFPKDFGEKRHQEQLNHWIGGEAIQAIQLLIAISVIKVDLFYMTSRAINRLFQPFCPTYYDLSSEIINRFYNDDKQTYNVYKFIDNFPIIIDDIKSKNQPIPDFFQDIHEQLFNRESCQKFLLKKICQIKDDIYNIYRLRNMLVHLSNTQSKSLDYYARRSREYSYNLLLVIRAKIFESNNDTEIKPLDIYFREIIIDVNIAFEAVVNNDLNKFRNWIFH